MTRGDALDSIQIPDKTYFKIGEVAKLLDLQPYVLRYWETEFDSLDPEKTRSGQRAYRREDIELLVLIKTLLYDEMYTIAGARKQLKLRKKGALATIEPEAAQRLLRERDDLRAQNERLSRDVERLEEAASTLRQQASRFQLQNETLEDENAQLAAAQLEYESSIRRLREELEQQRATVSMLDDARETLKQKLDEQASDFAAQNSAASEEELAALRAERDDARTTVQQLRAEVDSSARQLAGLESELQAARAAEGDASERASALADRVAALEARLAELRQHAERLEEEKATLQVVIDDSSQLDALQAELEQLRRKHDLYVQSAQASQQRRRQNFGIVRQELESLAALVN